jgi:hypothetical protein
MKGAGDGSNRVFGRASDAGLPVAAGGGTVATPVGPATGTTAAGAAAGAAGPAFKDVNALPLVSPQVAAAIKAAVMAEAQQAAPAEAAGRADAPRGTGRVIGRLKAGVR